MVWTGEGRWGEHASVIAWGSQVLVFRENGMLVVGEVSGDGLRAVRTYRVGGARMWGHPAVVGDRVLVRDGSRLVVYGLVLAGGR